MSSTVNNSFITQYTAEVTALFQQKQSLLRTAVRNIGGIRGSSFKVPVSTNKAAAGTKSRGADLTPQGLDVGWQTINLAANYAVEWVEQFDELQTNVDLRQYYTKQLSQGLARQVDQVLITAMGTTSSADFGSSLPTANTLDGAGLRAIAKKFNQLTIPQQDRVLLIHSGGLDHLASDPEVSNKFYAPTEILSKGYIDNYYGFKIIRIEDESLLPTTTVGGKAAHTCYAWSMDQVVLGTASEPEIKVGRIEIKDLDQIMAKMLMGAGVPLSTGVIPVTILD